MHDIKAIRENPTDFIELLSRRGEASAELAQRLVDVDAERRRSTFAAESLLAKRRALSDQVKVAIDARDLSRAEALRGEVTNIKGELQRLETQAKLADEQLEQMLKQIPNLPLPEVPLGYDEHGNVQRQTYGRPRHFSFAPKPHDELGHVLGQMDFKSAAKLSGSRFVVLKRGLARLERAIGQFMLDLHTTDHGYVEVNPPLLVRDNVMFGTGQLPKFWEDQFETYPGNVFKDILIENFENVWNAALDFAESNTINAARFFGKTSKPDMTNLSEETRRLWLVPTAEVSLTNLVRESILDESELPIRVTALTPCFRAEAGAAGRDTRGMIRQHQFTKVELVSITTPETSRDEHERMLSCAEEVLRRLDLPYRVMTLCSGDMGFSAQKTYDIEVWMPGQGEGGAFREISSCSVCGDFQARRMKARYRTRENKTQFVHTLNGSGTAVGRALIAVMETYQQEDGSIAVPNVLQPYMGGLKTIERDK